MAFGVVSRIDYEAPSQICLRNRQPQQSSNDRQQIHQIDDADYVAAVRINHPHDPRNRRKRTTKISRSKTINDARILGHRRDGPQRATLEAPVSAVEARLTRELIERQDQ